MARQKSSASPKALHNEPFEPRFPVLAACGVFSLWIALLSLPMLSGQFVASPFNDQYSSGYAYREWAAQWWKTLGHVPLWNPEIFGGMPFLAGMSGDVLYPTAWLRLFLPTHAAMNLGFVIHYILAGAFTYWFLRRWGVSWTGAVVGGLAYQLSGVVGSYVSPGHDGKLFVTAMLPLLLVGLTLGVRDRKLEGYAIAALAVGLIMLSPHPQMAEYALLAAGIFTLFLAFGTTVTSTRERLTSLGLALGAVVVGVGVAAAQYLPFYVYIPYSPRAASVLSDFEWSAAYAIPWAHVPEFVIPRFTGESLNGTYWGPNGLKLHSEYLGLIVVSLAIVGGLDRERRRMTIWLLAIAAVFLLIALGSATPFFRLWWQFVPFAQSTRAPGMALFVVSFVAATLAAFGVDRVLAGKTPRFAVVALGVGAGVALLGVAGLFSELAASLGRSVEALGLPNRGAIADAAGTTIRSSAFGAGIALALVGLLTRLRGQGKLSARLFTVALVGFVGTDLWLNARTFWRYSRAHTELFGGDAIKAHLRGVKRPFRVWDVAVPSQNVQAVYDGAALMADDIAQLFGHHANEPHAFDLLNGRLGRDLIFTRAGHPRILDLFAVNYLIVQADAAPDSIPGFRRVVSSVGTSSGATASLFERVDAIPYARLIPAAAGATLEQSVTTVLTPDFPVDRVVLIDSSAAKSVVLPQPLPAPVSNPIAVEDYVPGRMRLRLASPAAAPGYVMVSENWDVPWKALVDGRDVPVLRGNATLITIPIPANARVIDLRYESVAYARGKLIAFISLALVGICWVVPVVLRRRARWNADVSSHPLPAA